MCLALTGYAYFGYGVLLWICVYIRKQSIQKADYTPAVSIIIAARNEAANLPSKMENLRMLDYPKERLEIVVASDGSTDRTAEILLEQPPPVALVFLKSPAAKRAL